MATLLNTRDSRATDPGGAHFSDEDYRRRVPLALGGTAVMRVLMQALATVTTVLMARMVPPPEYGIFAAAIILNSALSVALGVGVQSALVQMRKDPSAYVDTVWTTRLVSAVLAFGLVFVVAPWWSEFLHVPEAVDMLRLLGLAPLITAVGSGGAWVLRRNLRFRRLFLLDAIESVSYTAFALAAGFLLHNAWALVIGLLGGLTVRAIATHLVTPRPVRISFDWPKYVEMYRYSRWLRGSSVLGFALNMADNMLVARVVGTTSVGLYNMAFQIATRASSVVTGMLNEVAFPAFSRIQTDRERVRVSFRGLIGLQAALLMPVTAILLTAGDLVLRVVLGPGWGLASETLRFLALAICVRAFLETAPQVLRALGYTRADFLLRVTQAVPLLLLLYPAARFNGIVGVGMAVLAAAVIALPAWAYVLTHRAPVTLRDLAEPLVAPIIASTLGALGVVVLPAPRADWQDLVARLALFAAVYLGVSALLYRWLPASGLAAARRVMHPAPAAPDTHGGRPVSAT